MVGVPGTARCVRTILEDDDGLGIVADKLSDLVVLQKEHNMQQRHRKLAVFVNRVLRQDADGISAHGRTEGWQQACTHLLETYHPAAVQINVVRTNSDIPKDHFFMTLEDGSLYGVGLNANSTKLLITM